MGMGGGAEFPDVAPRFDVQPKYLFGPFWQLRVADTETNRQIPVSGGGLLTGYGSVRRAGKDSMPLFLVREAQRARRRDR